MKDSTRMDDPRYAARFAPPPAAPRLLKTHHPQKAMEMRQRVDRLTVDQVMVLYVGIYDPSICFSTNSFFSGQVDAVWTRLGFR